MRNKVYQLFGWICCVCLFFCISCKEHPSKQEQKIILPEKEESVNSVIDKELVKERKLYNVEGVNRDGATYRGKVALKGDVGAGKICKEDEKEIYIEVKRSLEGGLEGVDNNGNTYQLLFTSID